MQTTLKKGMKPFSQISNEWIVDSRLTDSAYRLLCYIEMQADNWVFRKEEIKNRFKRGEDKYSLTMRSLKKFNYVAHYPHRDEKGIIDHWVLELLYGSASGWITQGVAEPVAGEHPQYNNNNSNNNNLNNNNENNTAKAVKSVHKKTKLFYKFRKLDLKSYYTSQEYIYKVVNRIRENCKKLGFEQPTRPHIKDAERLVKNEDFVNLAKEMDCTTLEFIDKVMGQAQASTFYKTKILTAGGILKNYANIYNEYITKNTLYTLGE